jgi:hypothetical protein
MLSMGSFDGVYPCVEPNLILFVSFYVPSILLSVENFDVSSHFDLDLSQLEKILLLLQFFFTLLHSKFAPFMLRFKSVVVGNNVANLDDVISIDFVSDVSLHPSLWVSMKKNFRMSTKVMDEQTNTLQFGPKMLLMSGVNFRGF